MKKTKIWYWVFTILLAGLMLSSAIPSIMVSADSVKVITDQLGYPKYIIAFLGVAKLLGVIAILIPGYPTVKEWAYAGFTFDLAGAMYSSIAIGEKPGAWLFFLLFFVLVAGSYILYHKKQKSVTVNLARG